MECSSKRDTFFENAQSIFEVARASVGTENQDFALLIRPDGGLQFVMESPFSIEAAALDCGARTSYRVTRSRDGVSVHGRSPGRNCLLEERRAALPFTAPFMPERLRDQVLYRIMSPLLTS
jgi:hypothetical protein